MTLKELKTGLLALLQRHYPPEKYKYYGTNVVEGYERPCFFTQLKQIDTSIVSYNVSSNRIALYITAMPELADEAAALDLAQSIRDIFGLSVKIGDRAAHVVGYDWDFVGSDQAAVQISVVLEWHDRIEHKTDAPLVGDIIIKKEMRE